MTPLAAWLVPDRLRLARARARGEHLLVAGELDLILPVIRRVAPRRTIVAWSGDADRAWIRATRRAGALPCADPVKAGIATARGALVLTRQAGRAGDLLRGLADVATRFRTAGDPLDVIIWTGDAEAPVALRDEDIGHPAIRWRVAATANLLARDLLHRYPIDRFGHSGVPTRRVVLIGKTPVIDAIARRLAIAHHGGGGLELLWSDAPGWPHPVDNPDGALPARRPLPTQTPWSGLIDECPVAIFVDRGDGEENATIARALAASWQAHGRPAPPIFARAASGVDDPMMRVFGDDEHVIVAEMLLQEEADQLARSVHEFYLDGRLGEGDRLGSRASMAEWSDLPERLRDDNRLLADTYLAKLRDLGIRLGPGDGPPLRLGTDEVEALARAEHARWLAARLLDGWRWAERRDDDARLHPDLVAYDALTERARELDREQIRLMGHLIVGTGLQARRMLDVAVEPGAIRAATSLTPLFEAVTRQFPDRILRLTVVDTDGATLAALARAGEAQPLYRLLVTAPIAATDAALVDRADTILVVARDDAAAAVRAAATLVLAPNAGADRRTIVLGADGQVLAAPWLA